MKPNDEMLHDTCSYLDIGSGTQCFVCERTLDALNPGVVFGLFDFVLCLECLLQALQILDGHARALAYGLEVLP